MFPNPLFSALPPLNSIVPHENLASIKLLPSISSVSFPFLSINLTNVFVVVPSAFFVSSGFSVTTVSMLPSPVTSSFFSTIFSTSSTSNLRFSLSSTPSFLVSSIDASPGSSTKFSLLSTKTSFFCIISLAVSGSASLTLTCVTILSFSLSATFSTLISVLSVILPSLFFSNVVLSVTSSAVANPSLFLSKNLVSFSVVEMDFSQSCRTTTSFITTGLSEVSTYKDNLSNDLPA